MKSKYAPITKKKNPITPHYKHTGKHHIVSYKHIHYLLIKDKMKRKPWKGFFAFPSYWKEHN